MTYLLIAALLSADPAPELPPAVRAERARLLLPGERWVDVELPGAWLPEPRLVAVAQELVRLRAENEALKAGPVATPAWVLIAIAVGLAAGFAGGAVVVWQVLR